MTSDLQAAHRRTIHRANVEREQLYLGRCLERLGVPVLADDKGRESRSGLGEEDSARRNRLAHGLESGPRYKELWYKCLHVGPFGKLLLSELDERNHLREEVGVWRELKRGATVRCAMGRAGAGRFGRRGVGVGVGVGVGGRT